MELYIYFVLGIAAALGGSSVIAANMLHLPIRSVIIKYPRGTTSDQCIQLLSVADEISRGNNVVLPKDIEVIWK